LKPIFTSVWVCEEEDPLAITFDTSECERFTVVTFEIGDGVCAPADLRELLPPQVPCSKGVILSGRGPIWLYARLVHEYHPAAWVATHDPRLGGGVVVESHIPGVIVGEVVPVEVDCR
jgi:CRISPR-associated protein Csx3